MPLWYDFMKIDARFVRFLLVGGLNTMFGYSVFSLCIFLGCHYILASFISTVAGMLFNFKTTGLLVFRNTNNSLIFQFAGVYMFVYGVNVLFLKLLDGITVNAYVSGAIAVVPVALLSFFLLKKIVFKESP